MSADSPHSKPSQATLSTTSQNPAQSPKELSTHIDAIVQPKPNDYPTFWIMLLGLIVAIGPLSIDMYLPAIPEMAKDFGISTAFMSNSVPAYFIGLVVGQLFYGPISDRIGRIKPLYVGMVVYVIASVLCATTSNEYVLFLARMSQALGACVGTVVTRAMIRDRLHPQQMAKAFSLMVLVMGLAPILAPSLGTLLLKFASWRIIFWFLAGFGLFSLVITKLFLHETLQVQNRNTFPLSQLLEQYWDLLKDDKFNYPAIGGGLLMGAMFVYISAAPELIMEGYGVTSQHFSWIFGMNAAGFIGMTQVNQFLVNRFELVSLLRFGAVMQVLASGCLLFLGLAFGTKAYLPLVLASIFCCIAALGLTQPIAGTIALAYQKRRAGMASALQGSLNFMVGIFGGLMLHAFPINAVAKLGLTMCILMALGTWLVFKIDKNLNVTNID